MEIADILMKLGKNATLPTQGYEGDFAHDIYLSEDTLIVPSTFSSVIAKTELRTAFDEEKYGLFLSMRSGGVKTPLIIPNAPGIVEGTYRNGIGVPLRNTFIASGLAPYVITINKEKQLEKVDLKQVSQEAKDRALKAFKEEVEFFGFVFPQEKMDHLFTSFAPEGTMFLPKGFRIAQGYLINRVQLNKIQTDGDLPESVRGENGFGSSGHTTV